MGKWPAKIMQTMITVLCTDMTKFAVMANDIDQTGKNGSSTITASAD